jgi:hypothetical protein
MNATKPTKPVRNFLRALRDGTNYSAYAETIQAAIDAGWVTDNTAAPDFPWFTGAAHYSLTEEGRAVA